MTQGNPFDSKQRIIQEFVPGKQVTMAHLIANPNDDLYKKLGVVSKTRGALGILTITPSEAAIIEPMWRPRRQRWKSYLSTVSQVLL